MFYRPDLTSFGFQWVLTDKCNYHCPYCFDQKKDLVNPDYTVLECCNFVNRMEEEHGRMQVSFSGGEPTIHPVFFPLVRHLAERGHVVFVVTNLSQPEELFQRNVVDPSLCWINASYHSYSSDLLSFVQKVKALNRTGFNISCSQVLYPPKIEEARANREFFRQFLPDVYFGFNVFFGKYQGRSYPESYDGRERDLLRELGIDLDQRIEQTEVRGYQFCRAGKDFFTIGPEGEILRCPSRVPLLREDYTMFSLLRVSFPCPLYACLCPDMYEFREERYL